MRLDDHRLFERLFGESGQGSTSQADAEVGGLRRLALQQGMLYLCVVLADTGTGRVNCETYWKKKPPIVSIFLFVISHLSDAYVSSHMKGKLVTSAFESPYYTDHDFDHNYMQRRYLLVRFGKPI